MRTPEEVRLELNARTALAQQRLARRAVNERTQTAPEQARMDLERARDERAAAKAAPEARRARARRRTRLTTVSAVADRPRRLGRLARGLDRIADRPLEPASPSPPCALLLQKMNRVGARAVIRESVAPVAVRTEAAVQDVALPTDRRGWAPRELPRPLTVSAGSRASAVLDAAAARESLRQAAVEEAVLQRAEAQRPPSIAARARTESAELGRRGPVDDAEIEAHVRRLLASRAG